MSSVMQCQLSCYIAAAMRVLLAVWVGGLWITGLLVAPVLFAALDDRALAGSLAGTVFSAMSYVGLGCGGALLGIAWQSNRLRTRAGSGIVVMLAIVAGGEFILQPLLAGLRAGGFLEGSADAVRFGRLHGLAATLHLVAASIGLWLVARGGLAVADCRREPDAGDGSSPVRTGRAN